MWLKKTKAGKVTYCERYKDPMTGKNKDISVTFDKANKRNEKEAARIIADRIRKLQSPEPKDMTLSQLVDEYRKDQLNTVKQSTYERNYWALESIKRMLGKDVLVSKLTARYVRNKFLASGKEPSTLNEHYKRFSAFIRWAYRSDLIESTAVIDKMGRFQDAPHSEKISAKFLEADELRLLLSKMEQPLWKLVVKFLALSGLRVGEFIALEKKDVDVNNGVVHISKSYDSVNRVCTTAKTSNSIADVFMQPELVNVAKQINQYMVERQMLMSFRTTHFVSDDHGDYMNYYSFNKYFAENTDLIIGRKLTTHSLRHTHASLLFENGFSYDEVSRRLRHGDSRITKEIYVHVTKKLKEKDAEKLRLVSIL